MVDPLVQCPFELSHCCKRSRFHQHLIKCRKNHPESKLKPCPYNASEYIHPDNLMEHLKVCKNFRSLERQKYFAEQHRDYYLDAPFHLPKPKFKVDFEDAKKRVNGEDERVLEQSVSQVSLTSTDSVQSFGNKISKSSTPLNSLRGRGRGYAWVDFLLCMEQLDEMDYSKYEIRSTIKKEDISESQFEDVSEEE